MTSGDRPGGSSDNPEPPDTSASRAATTPASSRRTTAEAAPQAAAVVATGKKVDLAPKDEGAVSIEQHREGIRGILASFLIAVLGAMILLNVALLSRDALTLGELKSVSELLIVPLFGIVGTILGFYFGSKATEDKETPVGAVALEKPRDSRTTTGRRGRK